MEVTSFAVRGLGYAEDGVKKPDYFNKGLSNDAPRLLMVELVKNSYWYMYKLEQKVKQPGGLTSLIAIVNPGKLAP